MQQWDVTHLFGGAVVLERVQMGKDETKTRSRYLMVVESEGMSRWSVSPSAL